MFSEILLPIFVMLIMFGIGINLTVSDFSRLFRSPKPIVLGLALQLMMVPMLGFSICKLMELPAHLSIGLMVITACPGGALSNVVSQLAKGNLPLSISLTAISTIVCVFSAPMIIGMSGEYFSGEALGDFSLLKTSISLFFVSALPVVTGMLVRHKFTRTANKLIPWTEKLSTLLVALMVIGVVMQQRNVQIQGISQLVTATICLNVVSTLVSILIAHIMSLTSNDSMTIGIEAGIQNSALAIFVSISIIGSAEYAMAATVYGLSMITCSLFIIAYRKWVQIPRNSSGNLTQI